MSLVVEEVKNYVTNNATGAVIGAVCVKENNEINWYYSVNYMNCLINFVKSKEDLFDLLKECEFAIGVDQKIYDSTIYKIGDVKLPNDTCEFPMEIDENNSEDALLAKILYQICVTTADFDNVFKKMQHKPIQEAIKELEKADVYDFTIG